MVVALREMETSQPDIRDEKTWEELYSSLRPSVKKLIHTRPLDSWYGQEDDLVEDVVQETMYRLLKRVLKAERNEMVPVNSLKHMMFVIASNYCKDLRRRDYRLLPFEKASYSLYTLLDSVVNPADIATEEAYCSKLFELIANEVAYFPVKQRKVLLTDIAKHMAFEQPVSALEKAFLDVGIEIRAYRHFAPRDLRERNRYHALLSFAYKRLFQAPAIRQYILQQSNG
jgi:DNA-directed RNA polymerase specialized sigma24 family protein